MTDTNKTMMEMNRCRNNNEFITPKSLKSPYDDVTASSNAFSAGRPRYSEKIESLHKSFIKQLDQISQSRDHVSAYFIKKRYEDSSCSPLKRRIQEYINKKNSVGKLFLSPQKLPSTAATPKEAKDPLKISWDEDTEEYFQSCKSFIRKRSHGVFFFFFRL